MWGGKMEKSDLYTIDEISRYLKLTKGTVYKLCQYRKIPYFKAGKQLRFRKDSIDKWITREEKRKKRKNRKGKWAHNR